MNTIISLEEVTELSKHLLDENKTVVLVGGCFDLLHIGHIRFLQEAKQKGTVLILLLESDETIKKVKGPKRPINTQQDRAEILSALKAVDYIVLLKPDMKNQDYDQLVIQLKPAIIATTIGDIHRHHKERQASLVNATVIDVTAPISDKSTTSLIKLLDEL